MSDFATFHDLRGKSVFITGGGSGIGAALTEGFVAQGARVAFVQRSDGAAFCDKIAAIYGVQPLFIRCDITDLAALRAAVDEASAAHGAVNVLVNNAANDTRHTPDEVSEEFWDANQAINLKAGFFAAQAVAPGMRAAGGGSIINMSSISYMMGQGDYVSYTTANSGLNGMTRSLARAWGGDRIRVNALAPGWVLTEKQRELYATPEALAHHLSLQCLPDEMQPEDVVDAVLFLASGASRMMTGQAMVVDGGTVVTG